MAVNGQKSLKIQIDEKWILTSVLYKETPKECSQNGIIGAEKVKVLASLIF